MTFHELHQRLIEDLRRRVRNGEMTERGLARATNVSQPHMHQVLKGKKLLSAEMADVVLHYLQMDLLDLIDPAEWLESRRPE